MSKDKYQLDLDEKKIQLIQCQKEKNLTSCMNCEHLFDCEIRTNYVKATYDSMLKGQNGGFEF
jgi:hypothetical protein